MNGHKKPEAEYCILPTVTIVAIIMLCQERELHDKIDHFLHETPVSTNYLIETDHDWHLGEHKKLYKVLATQRRSRTCFDQHIHLPNLNDHCHLGLSEEQAMELKEFDRSGICDWTSLQAGHAMKV